ncbi:MAG: family 43 glycosylhydrolase [Spirochaetales bacterium]|nr:family 43 glycosylhydrolase [Spirochaetales bacterium]
MERAAIQIRDPFIYTDSLNSVYYLFGTTDPDPWKGTGIGFDVYTGTDLEFWNGPFRAFIPPAAFWANRNFWAPEVHKIGNRFYMFASFHGPSRRRGTQILSADKPYGPFACLSDGPLTPSAWECLDGTFYQDPDGQKWLIFCHEWVQANDGEICALKLNDNLDAVHDEPVLLFRASEAAWPSCLERRDGSGKKDARVTDGPFVYRHSSGVLCMLWSSLSSGAYAMGLAVSLSGKITGPWVQSEKPLIAGDGGHGMIFRSLDNRLMLAWHSPNTTPYERFCYAEIRETAAGLELNDAIRRLNDAD